jgi:glycerol-3-phosphate acyltransferase PlsY
MDWTFWIKLAAVVVAGYLLGSVNPSIIVGKLRGFDIRTKGSGNAGVTNTLRTMGKKAAIPVLAGDVLKGVLACVAGMLLVGTVDGLGQVGVIAGGAAAILGHNWPVFFGFKGGRGVLTSLAVMLMADWRVALIALGVFAIVVAATRYVSLGSILAALSLPFLALLPGFYGTASELLFFMGFAAAAGLLIILRHLPNIKRLVTGTESKLGQKKETPPEGGPAAGGPAQG